MQQYETTRLADQETRRHGKDGRSDPETAHRQAGEKMAEKAGALSAGTETDRSGGPRHSEIKEFQSDERIYSAWQCDGERPCAECGQVQYRNQRESAHILQQKGADSGGVAARLFSLRLAYT